MIYVVEVPEEGRPRGWFAFDQQDFIRKVRAEKETEQWMLLVSSTPRQMLEALGKTPDTAEARSEHPDTFALAESHGWDTVLYRADFVTGQGIYQAEPVSEFDACVGAVAHDLKDLRVYLSDESATTALYRDPLYDGRDGFYAHMALREQLIALEIISDEM